MTLTQMNDNDVTSWAGTTSTTDFERRYTVNATCQVPSARSPNCYAVSRSPDSSSFQITTSKARVSPKIRLIIIK